MTDDEAVEIIKRAAANGSTLAEINATLRANCLTAVIPDGKEKRIRATMVCLRMKAEGRSKAARIAEMKKPEWWQHAPATARKVGSIGLGGAFKAEAQRRIDIEDSMQIESNSQ